MADVITRLRVESQEYDSKIKRASQGLLQMEEACRRVGGTLAILDKEDKAFVQSLGKMETVSKTARGSLGELTAAFTDLSMQYKRLTEEEKKGDFGTALKTSLDQLKGRIAETKSQLKEIDTELNGASQGTGDFSGVLSQLGSKLGINSELLGAVTAGTMSYVAAAGAAITATIAATKALADYNTELSKQSQIVTVTTGLDGSDANRLRDAADAMAKVYGVDFREVINAANILITQFGKNGDEAIQLLRDGMQGMIAGDGPKMLNMIQQFAPAFRDAGVSADQLVAVIHNSEGGLFSEQNMSAILMGIKNIRLMTNQTSDALAKLGIDGEEMSRKMSEGTMTVFEALHQVAVAIEGANAGSQEAGQVMQYVFGRQGAMQGMKLGRAIAELNLNLEQTKKQTGELGAAFNQLEQANEALNKSIRESVGYEGWEEQAKVVESQFVGALSMAINAVNDLRKALYDLSGVDVFANMADSLITFTSGLLGPVGSTIDTLRKFLGFRVPSNIPENEGTPYNRDNFKNPLGNVFGKMNPTSSLSDKPKATNQQELSVLEKEKKAARDNAKAVEELNARLTALNKLRSEAKDDQTRKYYTQQIADVQSKLNKQNGGNGGGSKKGTAQTPQQLAANIVESAEATYAQTLIEASLRVEAGIDDTAAYKKKELQAQEQLLSAYGKAYTIYNDPRYKEAYDAAAVAYRQLAAEVKAETDAAARQKEAAKALEQAQKKLTDAQSKLDIANQSGNLKEIRSAQKSVTNAQTEVERLTGEKAELPTIPLNVRLTTENLSAYLSDLKTKLAQADLGTEAYTKLNAQMVDATTLKTMMQVALQEGLNDIVLELGPMWQEILNTDDIPDEVWQNLGAKLQEELKATGSKKRYGINRATGEVSEVKGESKNQQEQFAKGIQTMTGTMSSIAGGIQQMGVDIPEGLNRAITMMQGISTILTAILTITTLIKGEETVQTVTGFLPFFKNGGIIPHAAKGMVIPGNDYADVTPVFASSGELILNRAAQNSIAGQLEGASQRNNGGGTPYVLGEQIWLGVNNYLRRNGRGEIVTANRR